MPGFLMPEANISAKCVWERMSGTAIAGTVNRKLAARYVARKSVVQFHENDLIGYLTCP